MSAPTYTPKTGLDEYKAVFRYSYKNKHFNIEPLVKFQDITNDDANDFREEMALGNIGKKHK